jgi:hypothetical protein
MSVTVPGRSHIIPGLHETALAPSGIADPLHHPARVRSVAVDLVSPLILRRSVAIGPCQRSSFSGSLAVFVLSAVVIDTAIAVIVEPAGSPAR